MSGRKLGRMIAPAFALFLVAFLVGGCGDLDTGNSDESGSVFLVGDITSWYDDEELADQVDLIQDCCEIGETGCTDVEFYSDHLAKVELYNLPWPNAAEDTASPISLQSYQIEYFPIGSAPALPPVAKDRSSVIPPCLSGSLCSPTEIEVFMVPTATKDLIAAAYTDTGGQLSYNMEYTFFGVNEFGENVSAKGPHSFLAGNYNMCDQ